MTNKRFIFQSMHGASSIFRHRCLYIVYKHTNQNKKNEFSVLQFADILGGQLIKSQHLISHTMSVNQQIILQYRNKEEIYTDVNGSVHRLRRGDMKVSPTFGKMYRPACDCVMCKLTHCHCQTIYYCDIWTVPLSRKDSETTYQQNLNNIVS